MIISFLLLYILLLLSFYKKNKKTFRPITVLGYTVLFYVLYVFCTVEILSIFHLISSTSIMLCWLLLDIFILYKILTFKKYSNSVYKKLKKDISVFYNKNKKCIIISSIFVLIVTLISGFIVPYNWDSLSYHLTRIVVWFNNGTVEHFPTIDTRMLGTPPLKEFLDLHVYAIIGNTNDVFLNLTQTFSYLFNILFVVEIADRIGCKKRGKILSALIFASSPICLAEAFSTQTDQFAALFVLIFIILSLDIIKNTKLIGLDKDSFSRIFTIGLCLGFTYLAKPSGLFAILIFTLYIFIVCLKNKVKFKNMIIWVLSVGLIAGIVLFPELFRNYLTYGSIMDPWQGPGQLVLSFDPRYLIVNMLKNYGTNLVGFVMPFFTNIFPRLVYFVARIFGINATDSTITEIGGDPYVLNQNNSFSFETAGNYLIFLILPIIFIIFIIKIIKNKKINNPYGIAALVTFFVALSFIKWEPFMVRYLVAYIGVITPFIAFEIENISINKIISKFSFVVVILASFILLILGLHEHIGNTYMSSFSSFDSREQAYYVANEEEYYTIYTPLRKELGINHFDNIGLDIYTPGSYNYPVMKLLLDHANNVKIVNVRNSTSKYEDSDFIPDLIVVTCYKENGCPNDFNTYIYHDKQYNNVLKISTNLWIITED